MKRFLSVIVLILILVTLISVNVFAQEETREVPFEIIINGDVYTPTYVNDHYELELNVGGDLLYSLTYLGDSTISAHGVYLSDADGSYGTKQHLVLNNSTLNTSALAVHDGVNVFWLGFIDSDGTIVTELKLTADCNLEVDTLLFKVEDLERLDSVVNHYTFMYQPVFDKAYTFELIAKDYVDDKLNALNYSEDPKVRERYFRYITPSIFENLKILYERYGIDYNEVNGGFDSGFILEDNSTSVSAGYILYYGSDTDRFRLTNMNELPLLYEEVQNISWMNNFATKYRLISIEDAVPNIVTIPYVTATTTAPVVVDVYGVQCTLDETYHVFLDNGSHTFTAKDKDGNILSETIVINNIQSPVILSNITPERVTKEEQEQLKVGWLIENLFDKALIYEVYVSDSAGGWTLKDVIELNPNQRAYRSYDKDLASSIKVVTKRDEYIFDDQIYQYSNAAFGNEPLAKVLDHYVDSKAEVKADVDSMISEDYDYLVALVDHKDIFWMLDLFDEGLTMSEQNLFVAYLVNKYDVETIEKIKDLVDRYIDLIDAYRS